MLVRCTKLSPSTIQTGFKFVSEQTCPLKQKTLYMWNHCQLWCTSLRNKYDPLSLYYYKKWENVLQKTNTYLFIHGTESYLHFLHLFWFLFPFFESFRSPRRSFTKSAKQTGLSVVGALTGAGSPFLVARWSESSDSCVPQEEQNFQLGEQNE